MTPPPIIYPIQKVPTCTELPHPRSEKLSNVIEWPSIETSCIELKRFMRKTPTIKKPIRWSIFQKASRHIITAIISWSGIIHERYLPYFAEWNLSTMGPHKNFNIHGIYKTGKKRAICSKLNPFSLNITGTVCRKKPFGIPWEKYKVPMIPRFVAVVFAVFTDYSDRSI